MRTSGLLRALGLSLALILAADTTGAGQAAAPLRVGTSGDYPPFSIAAADGARSGFDVDLATRLAAELGRPLELVSFRWPELAAQAKGGAFDLVASGVTIHPERTLIGRFTRPYANSEAVVLVRPADADRLRSLADVDKAGMRVVVNRGGYLESVARATFQRATIEPLEDNRKLDEPVLLGRADALVTDSIEARHLQPLALVAALTRDRKAIFVPERIAGGGDARQLHATLDRWLRDHDDEITAFRARWLRGGDLEMRRPRVEALVALLDQRSGVAPWVASAKRFAGLPIEDPEREKKVLAAAAERARQHGLSEAPVVALFAVLIEASKDIQRAAAPIESSPTLDSLRGVLGDLDERLVAEVAGARPLDAAAAEQLRRDVTALRWPGLGEERKRALAATVVEATR